MSDQSKRWAVVAHQIERRLSDLGMTQSDLAKATGLSRETIRTIASGRGSNRRPATLSRIAVGLGWTADSIERILDGGPPLRPEDAIREAEEELYQATRAAANLGVARADRLVQAAVSNLEDVRRRYGPTETAAARAVEPDFAEQLLRGFKDQLHTEVDRLSFDELISVAVAISWIRARGASGLYSQDVARSGLVDAARHVSPSLDDLLWNPPDLGEADRIVRDQWATSRAIWSRVLAEHGGDAVEELDVPVAMSTRDRLDMLMRRYLAPSLRREEGPPDIEDHAMAAQSGQDPTGITKGPVVSRPSPEVGMDDDDLGA